MSLLRPVSAFAQENVFSHGSTLFDVLKYGADFKHFDYVNPSAPKGGRIRLGFLGSFDSLNALTLKGDPLDPGVYETLMKPSFDEPSSEYGLLASGLWFPEDFSRVTYKLRPEAKFHDGTQVTPEDVIFSLDSVKANLTQQAVYYKDIQKAEKTGDHEVTFIFARGGNRELPQITGQLSVVSQKWWLGKDISGKARDIGASSLDPPMGSAAYEVADVKPGSSFLLRRVKDHWGKDLPVNIGYNNFDEIELQVYRDQTVMLEAFKGDQFDVSYETVAKNWATGYDFPAIKDGRCRKEEHEKERVSGMQAWVVNLRREKFADVRVRKALNLAFDFEWSNTNLFFGQYRRSRSYFNLSELEAKGLPSPEELAILEPLRDKLPPEVFTAEFSNPDNTTSNDRRKNLREAQSLLTEAGWVAKSQEQKQLLQNAKGEGFAIEMLLYSPAFERIALPYKEQLELLGFAVSVRTVDLSQYERLNEDHAFDMIVGSWGQSLSPGNEQREFFGSEFADKKGSRNSAGIKNPAVDAIIEQLINAPNRKALVTATKALDRALIWNQYVVPMWFGPIERIAYWKRVKHPDRLPGYATSRLTGAPLGYPDIWWFDAVADQELVRK